ncbi:MAG TPA: hypothetical protein VN456_18600 [Desulfosporosinus sp.]|nr:hypothetical protein [Desulfosporosinus sp.]
MEKRSVYMEKTERNLAELNKRLDEMKVKAGVVQDDIKAEYRAHVKKLGTKRDDFMVKYGELMNIQDKWTATMNEGSNHVVNSARIADSKGSHYKTRYISSRY